MICVFFVAVIFRRHQPVAVWEIPEYIWEKHRAKWWIYSLGIY